MTFDAASAGLLAGLAAAPLCWYGVVKRRRAMGKSAAVAHTVGLASSPFVMLSVFGLFSEPSGFSLIFAAIVFSPLALFVRQRSPSEARAIAADDPVVSIPPPAPPEIDLQALEATRRRSLDALRRSTKARDADKRLERSWEEQHLKLAEKKRGSPLGDPLANWRRTAPTAPKKRERAAQKKKIAGRKLDVVRFGYINADGEYLSRRVAVNVVAGTYFKGIDTDISETRTFRYDSVVGGLTSELSGEVLLPEEWAAGFR